MSYQTARFKERINGSDVVVELKPGQSLRWGEVDDTDEGWSSTTMEWEYSTETDDGLVFCTITNDGVDCDGRLTDTRVYVCSVSDLRVDTRQRSTGKRVEVTEGGETWTEDEWVTVDGWPKWDDCYKYIFDANAVAAGY